MFYLFTFWIGITFVFKSLFRLQVFLIQSNFRVSSLCTIRHISWWRARSVIRCHAMEGAAYFCYILVGTKGPLGARVICSHHWHSLFSLSSDRSPWNSWFSPFYYVAKSKCELGWRDVKKLDFVPSQLPFPHSVGFITEKNCSHAWRCTTAHLQYFSGMIMDVSSFTSPRPPDFSYHTNLLAELRYNLGVRVISIQSGS